MSLLPLTVAELSLPKVMLLDDRLRLSLSPVADSVSLWPLTPSLLPDRAKLCPLAIETLPPFLMAGVRFLAAGGLLFAGLRLRGASAPSARQWRASAIVGVLLFVGGNGLVCWAEHWVPTGITALLIASTPLWMTLLPWLARRARLVARVPEDAVLRAGAAGGPLFWGGAEG